LSLLIFLSPLTAHAQCTGDFNSDSQVNFSDLLIFAVAYNTTSSDAKYNPACDLNNDDAINFSDLLIFAVNYGEDCRETKEWTIMIYMDGDNNLDDYAWDDLSEMQSIGSSNDVNIVTQMDLYSSCSGTYRYHITGSDPGASYPLYPDDIVQTLPEQNMSDLTTLTNFINWATENYPAEKYVLILWDHGAGWKEVDFPTRGVIFDDTSGDYMTMAELVQGLEGADTKIDILGFDACLMQMTEVAYEISKLTNIPDYMIASQASEWSYGWPYDTILGYLISNPVTEEGTLCETIVDSFINDCGGLGTLSVIDFSILGTDTVQVINSFANALIASAYQSEIANARSVTQSYSYSSGYRCKDLFDFAQRIYNTVPDCQSEAQAVMNHINNLINYESHIGSQVVLSHGLSIYLPDNIGEYDSDYSTLQFATDSQWDEFLQYSSNDIPVVTTLHADNITQTSARVWFRIDDTGGEELFDAGVYWGLKEKILYPVLEIEMIENTLTSIEDVTENNQIEEISATEKPVKTDFNFEEGISLSTEKIGVGTYYVNLTGLSCNTTYQYMAYAENSAGEGLGEIEEFATSPCSVTAPAVSIGPVYDYSATEVKAYGNIDSTGGENPYKAGMIIADLTTGGDPIGWYITGDFQAGDEYYIIIPNLISGHTYSRCAYAENVAGIGYGDWWSFTKP